MNATHLHGPLGRTVAGALLVLAAAGPTTAQEVGGQGEGASGPEAAAPTVREVELDRALQIARDENARLQMSEASTEQARSRARSARSALLPQVELEAGWSRTVDPVGAFGTKLRQGSFEQADLALDALNDPAPISDWTGGATLRWAVASPRRWAGKAAAGDAARAAAWSEERTREATDFRTRVRFFGALRTETLVEAARSAVEAAEATVRRFQRSYEEGMLTRADLLQARAERSAARAELAEAKRSRHEARVRLALHLGWSPDDSLPDAAGQLSPPEPTDTRSFDAGSRADLRARRAALEAAESSLQQARFSWAPELGAFASWRAHAADGFGDDGTDWTVGLGLRWSLFTGFRRSARVGEARAQVTTARIEYEQARREARGEVRTARRGVEAAREAAEASRDAREAAREGRDLMRRRFEEGLATAADLLQAEARATRAESRSVEALARYHMAVARLEFVRARTDREVLR